MSGYEQYSNELYWTHLIELPWAWLPLIYWTLGHLLHLSHYPLLERLSGSTARDQPGTTWNPWLLGAWDLSLQELLEGWIHSQEAQGSWSSIDEKEPHASPSSLQWTVPRHGVFVQPVRRHSRGQGRSNSRLIRWVSSLNHSSQLSNTSSFVASPPTLTHFPLPSSSLLWDEILKSLAHKLVCVF